MIVLSSRLFCEDVDHNTNQHTDDAMRKRTELTNPPSPSNDDDSLPASHQREDETIRRFFVNNRDTAPMCNCNILLRLFYQLKEGKELWVQLVTIYTSAVLTYGYTNSKMQDLRANVQVAIMTVITLVGASPFSSTHLVPATIGVFAGGHNIIGSVGLVGNVDEVTWMSYLWLFLLSLVITLVWRFIMTKWKLFDGFAGRLGTTVFIGMNFTMLLYAPMGVVSWDRYYYGLVQVLNSAEDSIPLSRAWFEEAELAIGYVVAVVSLGVVAGGTRVLHNNYIKRLEDSDMESQLKQIPPALNNVIVPVLWALFSMLVVILSGYRNAPVLFNGFAVGSYVAMASLQKIPALKTFAIVSLIAAGWGLALTPFFVGFPGKSGFTAMIGHITYNIFETNRVAWKVRINLRQQQMTPSPSFDDDYHAETSMQQQEAPESPHHHFKPKTENSVITKHQRRQQRKLKHLHLQNSPDEGIDVPAVLHHRAWSAVKEEADDGAWRHSLRSRPKMEQNSVV